MKRKGMDDMSEQQNNFENLDILREMHDSSRFEKKLMTDGLEVQVGEIKSIEVSETGHNTQVNIYYPEGNGPFPVMVYIHGGGMVTGFNKMDEPAIRQICRDVECAVISPNYVLAPQYQWPSALEELYELIRYFIQNAELYKLDKTRIAVGGNSAGGNLAAGLVVKAHQEKEFSFDYAALVYPALDISEAVADGVNDLTNLEAMSPEGTDHLRKLYIPDGENPENPLISPFYADPTIFPPTSIFAARGDLLMHQNKLFANKLTDAGVEVLFKCYTNSDHGFMEIAGNESVARDCRTIMATELKRIFSK
ncbi:alpha/beta hydrolase [Paenibacillus sinopodophylli]|uniref:alpha/beta hydrolase n=1 Tax=Paenibacillus sinopodophylli TaxID=1837342 RepID=UPI00110CE4FD|nr:alpha/beta hydrolase [Paenibacillus sinopodophylli]